MSIDVEAYYLRYGPMVLRRCRVLLRDEADAVDAMQEVFVRLLERADDLEHHAPSSLLFRIATHTCLNRIRTRKRHPEDGPDLLAEVAGWADAEARTWSRRLLDRLFGRSPESSRTIAVLHFVDGLTLEETALEVGMSVSGVRKRLRALRSDLALLDQELV